MQATTNRVEKNVYIKKTHAKIKQTKTVTHTHQAATEGGQDSSTYKNRHL